MLPTICQETGKNTNANSQKLYKINFYDQFFAILLNINQKFEE